MTDFTVITDDTEIRPEDIEAVMNCARQLVVRSAQVYSVPGFLPTPLEDDVIQAGRAARVAMILESRLTA